MDLASFEKIAVYLELPFYAFVGAFALYVLNRMNDNQPFSILYAINIKVDGKGTPLAILIDMLMSSALGAVIVIALTSPSTKAQAVAAGLGLTGVLSAFSKKIENGEDVDEVKEAVR